MYASTPALAGRRGVCMYAADTKLRNRLYPSRSDTRIQQRHGDVPQKSHVAMAERARQLDELVAL